MFPLNSSIPAESLSTILSDEYISESVFPPSPVSGIAPDPTDSPTIVAPPTRLVRTKTLHARFHDFTGLPSGNVVTTSLSSSSPASGILSSSSVVYPIQDHISYQKFTPKYRVFLTTVPNIPTPYSFQQAAPNPH